MAYAMYEKNVCFGLITCNNHANRKADQKTILMFNPWVRIFSNGGHIYFFSGK